MNDSGLKAGDRVGPYEVLAPLGRGGMGQVYKAVDTRLSREVALKVLRSDGDAASLLRFADEARAVSRLSHPNVVVVYDVGEDGGSPYIVTELLEGETLRERLADGPLPLRKAVDGAVQVLRGLEAAHANGIVHRDLKPENLFVTKTGLVKILDFGIAKLGRPVAAFREAETQAASHTLPGTTVGTVGYMSPEQVRGLAVDRRSDLFSLGAVLHEMITGERAFRGSALADTSTAVLRDEPVEAAGDPGLAAPVLRVIRRALEKAPEDRFQSARDMAFALEAAAANPRESGLRRGVPRALAAAVLAAVGFGSWWVGRATAPRPDPPSFRRLTFRPGQVQSARFAPDGKTIFYSVKAGNRPSELFSTRANARGERPLPLADSLVLGLSPRDELALMMKPHRYALGVFEGTLGRAPLAGGPPRQVLEGVLSADWSPDGRELAVVAHTEGERFQLEYPIGHVLYAPDPPTWISNARVSPRGDRIAFEEHPVAGDNGGSIGTVDLEGRRRTLASGFADLAGLAWSPGGDEVWLCANREGRAIAQQILAVSTSGRQRRMTDVLVNFLLFDVSPSGEVLGANVNGGTETRARAREASAEAELLAADYSFLSDLSDDGRLILGTDVGEGGGPNLSFYVQGTDGSPATWLGEGDGQALSPDHRFALAVLTRAQPQKLLVVPVGAGETRTLDAGDIVQYQRAVWDRSGRRVVFAGADKRGAVRVYVQGVAGGPPRAVTPNDVGLGRLGKPVAPDDRRLVAVGPDEVPALYSLEGGDPVAIPGLGRLDVVLCWTPDGRGLIVARYADDEDVPPRIERVEAATGRSQPWNRIRGGAPPGDQSTRILVAPDGESYAYAYLRLQADLQLSSRLN